MSDGWCVGSDIPGDPTRSPLGFHECQECGLSLPITEDGVTPSHHPWAGARRASAQGFAVFAEEFTRLDHVGADTWGPFSLAPCPLDDPAPPSGLPPGTLARVLAGSARLRWRRRAIQVVVVVAVLVAVLAR